MKSLFYKVWSSVLAVWMLCNINLVFPSVILPPRNMLLISGTNATMSCRVSSNLAKDVQWTIPRLSLAALNSDCTSLRNEWNVSCDATTNYLTTDQVIRNVTTLEAIRCSDLAEPSASAFGASFIPLTSLPVCSGPTSSPVRGMNVTLTCKIGFTPGVISDANDPPRQAQTSLSMTWQYLDGTPANGLVTSDANSSQLTVVATGLKFPSYVCVSTINLNTISASRLPDFDFSPVTVPCTTKEITIVYCPTNVSIVPSNSSTSNSRQVLAGTNFTCSSDGYPPPNVTWKVTPSVSLSSSQPEIVMKGGGVYNLTCTAATIVGSQPCNLSQTLTLLTVVDCPSIADAATKNKVVNGATLTINVADALLCTADSNPAPSFTWLVIVGLLGKSILHFLIQVPKLAHLKGRSY